MRTALSVSCFLLLCTCGEGFHDMLGPNGPKPIKRRDGIEFSKVSRDTLLKILAAFEQHLFSDLPHKKVKPIFTAQFANNVYSKPFLYP